VTCDQATKTAVVRLSSALLFPSKQNKNIQIFLTKDKIRPPLASPSNDLQIGGNHSKTFYGRN